MQDLNDMVYFAEVAERGGFAAASRALGIPKSRLSRRVAELELRLGVQLMQRSTRSLSLTPAGETYLRHSTSMRDAAQAAADAVAQVQTEPRGLVRLSCPVTMAQSTVGPLLPMFLHRWPSVRVDMRVTNRPVDPVEDGVDLALRVRPAIEDSATLVARSFGESRGLLVASPQLLAAHGPLAGPQDLSRLDTVSMSTADGRAQWQLEGPAGKVHSFSHTPRYVADDLASVRMAALQAVGVAVLPDYMCRADIAQGRLIRVLPDWGPPPVISHCVFPARRALVPGVRRLIDFLVEHVNADEPHDPLSVK